MKKARPPACGGFQWRNAYVKFHQNEPSDDRLCVLVVRVSGYRSRGLGFDSRPYQIFLEVGALERGPLSLVKKTEKLPELKK
jgi:hypothetical protein